jgi:hypothetical protein
MEGFIMSISRRQFLIGSSTAVAGLFLPSFAARVLSHVANTGEPLLEVSKASDTLFHAIYIEDHYQIFDTTAGSASLISPPPTTWREFFEFDGRIVSEEYLQENWHISLTDLDEQADRYAVEQQWEYSKCPQAQAFAKIQKFEDQIGSCVYDENDELGQVIFTEFPHPGSDERWVEVDTPEALSCLQHRLNSLHAGVRIEVLPDWP